MDRLFSCRKLGVRERARRHRLHHGRARQPDGTGKARCAGAAAHADIIVALLQNVGGGFFAEDGKLRHREAQMQRLLFARGKDLRFLERVEEPGRTCFSAVRAGAVDLHDLLHGVRFAGIFYGRAHGYFAAVEPDADRAELRLAVAQAIAEREKKLTAEGVKIAVAEEAVQLLRGKSERFELLGPAERQLAGRADLARQNIRQRIARLLPGKTEQNDGAAASCLLRQLHVARRGKDQHDAGKSACDLFEHVLLKIGELRVIVRRRARQNDDGSVVGGSKLLHAEISQRHLAALRMLERPGAVFVRQQRVLCDGAVCAQAVQNPDSAPRVHAGKPGGGKNLTDTEDGNTHGRIKGSGKRQRISDIFEQHAASCRSRAADKRMLVHSGCIFHGNLPSTVM